MSFVITESTTIKGLEVSVTLDTEFSSMFDSVYEYLAYEALEQDVDIRKDIDEFILMSIDSEISGRNSTKLVLKSEIISHIDKKIKALENRQEYELCGLYLKLKNKYNLRINEK